MTDRYDFDQDHVGSDVRATPSTPSRTAAVTQHTVDSGGVRLHVATAGAADATPVLLLHGFPDSWQCGAIRSTPWPPLAIL